MCTTNYLLRLIFEGLILLSLYEGDPESPADDRLYAFFVNADVAVLQSTDKTNPYRPLEQRKIAPHRAILRIKKENYGSESTLPITFPQNPQALGNDRDIFFDLRGLHLTFEGTTSPDIHFLATGRQEGENYPCLDLPPENREFVEVRKDYSWVPRLRDLLGEVKDTRGRIETEAKDLDPYLFERRYAGAKIVARVELSKGKTFTYLLWGEKSPRSATVRDVDEFEFTRYASGQRFAIAQAVAVEAVVDSAAAKIVARDLAGVLGESEIELIHRGCQDLEIYLSNEPDPYQPSKDEYTHYHSLAYYQLLKQRPALEGELPRIAKGGLDDQGGCSPRGD